MWKGHINPKKCHWNNGLEPLLSECNSNSKKIDADIDSKRLIDDQWVNIPIMSFWYGFYGVIY